MEAAGQSVPPPDSVLRDFGLEGEPIRPMKGGEGRSWRVGRAVLKPVDVPMAQLEWQADLFDSLQSCEGFRVPSAIRSRQGAFAVLGWHAMTFLIGRHASARWPAIIEVGELFHKATASVQRPAFLDDRVDPWSVGDRVAWGEIPIDQVPKTKHLDRLAANLRPLAIPSQLVHGDLTGNVLFDERLAPAIIDLAPYYRPVGFASAIVVADALVWEGADASVLAAVEHIEEFPQHLLRALIYRAVTDRLFRLSEPHRSNDDDPYLSVVDLAVSLVDQTMAN